MTDNYYPKSRKILARSLIEDLATQLSADDTAKPDVADWIEANFYIPETPDRRMRLAPYQKVVLREALRRDSAGNYVYATVLWSDIKKSLKSTIAAAVALYIAYTSEWATIYIIANDLKQAESRVSYYIRRAIELNPAMKVECHVKNYHTRLPNHSTIEAIPIDPTGEAGSNADLLVFSELWGWKHESAKRMWAEMTISPTKFGKSQRWVETYAGYEGESPILESLYETAVKGGERIETGIDDLELTKRSSILALWNTKPRLTWQSEPYYESEALLLHPTDFNRVHRNQWGRSSAAFVAAEWWDACKDTLPEFPYFAPMVLALDAGVSNDCFAMVGLTRYPDPLDPLGYYGRRLTYVRYVHLWHAPPNGKIKFSSKDPSETTPESELKRLSKLYSVQCYVYDPFQLEHFVSQLKDDGYGEFVEFKQGEDRLIADKGLYDMILNREIRHDGNAELREHVLNANAALEGKEEGRLRLVKRNERSKIDAAVAMSMGAHTARELGL
jgi:phage terminase large subunit-like protein